MTAQPHQQAAPRAAAVAAPGRRRVTPDAARGARVQLCGELEARIGGRDIAPRLRGRQGRALFAYLVLHRERSVSRDELIDALWPTDPPASA